MKSQIKRSDLPNLPGNDPKSINKGRPASRDADATVEKKSDKSAVENDGEKKARRSVLRQKSMDQQDGEGYPSRARILIDEYCSGPATINHVSENTGDSPNALGRFGPSNSVSATPMNRQRPSVTSESAEIAASTMTRLGVSDELGGNGSHFSHSASSQHRRRPSLKPVPADSSLPEDILLHNSGRRHSIAPDVPNDTFPKVAVSSSLKSGRRGSLANENVPDDILAMSGGPSRSRRASATAINSNNGLNGSTLNMDERSMSDRKKQSLLLKEASNMIHMPQRVLPGDFMEKYAAKRSTMLENKSANAGPKKELNSSQEALAKKEENSEEKDDSSVTPQISKAKKLWKKAFCHTVAGLRFLSLYEELRAKGMNIQRAKALEAEGLSVLLSASNISKGDPSISAKIKELTSKDDRSDEDIEALERILSIKNRAFGRFSLDQRLKFCKIVKYEYYKGERMIVREGHVSWAFYFILSGQAEIFKVKDNLKYRLNVIGAGTSFGDRTMNMLNDKRTASVASTMDIEMLKIDKTDFFDITNVRDEKGMASRSAKILQIPHFSTAPGGFIERIAPFAQIITYEPNEYILHEGVEYNKIFWLLKGTCQCIKMLPFAKKTINENYAGKNVQVKPFAPGKTVLEQGEEFFYEFATTYEVELGQNFVDLPVPTGGSLTEHCFYVNKRDYMEQLKNEDPRDLNSKAAVSVVAKTKVEAICINRVDYATLATHDMILSIINSKDIYRIPLSQLQESYLTTRKWNAHKKKVVADVSIDIDLMDPKVGGFVLEQLMELAGLSCAQVIQKEYNVSQFKDILVCAGPGNNGGDALVAARHLSHFGYSPCVICPKLGNKTLFQNLVTQCKNLNIPFLDGSISQYLLNYSLILDGIFGFSFKGTIRSPYDEMISSLKSCKIPIVSIDIPSGWDVELGNINNHGLEPSLLISLTYPKKCASQFMGKHYVGGRFLPDFIAKKYSIQMPIFSNGDQFVDITGLLRNQAF